MEATATKRAARYDRATPARTSDSRPAYGSRTRSIAYRRRRAKYILRNIGVLIVVVATVASLALAIFGRPTAGKPTTAKQQTAATRAPTTGFPEVLGQTLDERELLAPTTEPSEAEQTTPPVRYYLTDSERDIVERVVMGEAGGESFEGQMAVAQCILNGAEKTDKAPSEVVVIYKYTKARPDPTRSVREAVAAVFDRGESATAEPILYFYNPARVTSTWHESQIFVVEIGGHRFFAEKGADQ